MASLGERLAHVPVRRLLAALLVMEMLGIVWLVLSPSATTPTEAVDRLSRLLMTFGLPTWMVGGDQVEFALNVALFVPLTALAALLWPRLPLRGWVLLGFALSSTLEWVQLAFLSDRSSTSRDIIANTLGALVGGALVAFARFGRDVEWWAVRPDLLQRRSDASHRDDTE